MYERILVPLDGSKLAECVLPHVEELAKGCGTQEIILVSVTEAMRVRWAVPDASMPTGQKLMTDTMGKKSGPAHRYLVKIAKGLRNKGFDVSTEVLVGTPAEEIVRFAENDKADIIVIASHGRSGPSRWALGSVADKVFRASCLPVMMVRAPGCVPGI